MFNVNKIAVIFYSVLKATTGSWWAAFLAGTSPDIIVNRTLMAIIISADLIGNNIIEKPAALFTIRFTISEIK